MLDSNEISLYNNGGVNVTCMGQVAFLVLIVAYAALIVAQKFTF